MLTIIEGGSNVWMAITVDDELRLYSRAEAGGWGELSVSEDPEQVDPEKSFMLEELYGRQSGHEEDEEEVPEDEEEPDEEEEEPDEGGPELDEDEEFEDGEDEEPEEQERPRRRRATSARSGRTAARRR